MWEKEFQVSVSGESNFAKPTNEENPKAIAVRGHGSYITVYHDGEPAYTWSAIHGRQAGVWYHSSPSETETEIAPNTEADSVETAAEPVLYEQTLGNFAVTAATEMYPDAEELFLAGQQ